MPLLPKPTLVEREGDYVNVRCLEPVDSSESRTPQWATDAAADVREGPKVRTGQRMGGDEWVVQSVPIPESVG